MVMLSLVNRRCMNWNLYVARAAARGMSERAALAMVERAELVTRLEAAGVVNIGDDQSVADLRAVARELSRAGALPRVALRFTALLVALFLVACGAPALADERPVRRASGCLHSRATRPEPERARLPRGAAPYHAGGRVPELGRRFRAGLGCPRRRRGWCLDRGRRRVRLHRLARIDPLSAGGCACRRTSVFYS
jgi:hypothetical protein